jgi:hypothetical protein
MTNKPFRISSSLLSATVHVVKVQQRYPQAEASPKDHEQVDVLRANTGSNLAAPSHIARTRSIAQAEEKSGCKRPDGPADLQSDHKSAN